MKISPKPISLILLFAFVGLILNGVLFLKINEASQKKQQATNYHELLLRQKNSLDELNNVVLKRQKDITNLKDMLPLTLQDFVQFTADLSAAATESAQVIKLASEQQPRVEKKERLAYRTEAVTMELDGRYLDLLRFFEHLDNLPYFYSLEQIKIQKESQGEGVKTSVKVLLYMQ